MHYLPKFSIPKNEINGFEALFRWNHKSYGTISPVITVEIAEDIDSIYDRGKLALEKSVKRLKIWLDQGYAMHSVAINVSPAQLMKTDFIELVDKTIKMHPLSKHTWWS
jgi:EAL domain-containing protein (putative c-di-GMP-specific phosphodiesterase class I)